MVTEERIYGINKKKEREREGKGVLNLGMVKRITAYFTTLNFSHNVQCKFAARPTFNI